MSRLPSFARRIKRRGAAKPVSVRSSGSLRLKQPLAALLDYTYQFEIWQNEECGDLYCIDALFCGKDINKYTTRLQSLLI